MDKKKEFRLIGQGAYGCTIHPGLNCSTQRIGSVKYVSKLQIDDATTKSEIEMGKIIQKIPNYPFFFAPIIEHCPVNVSSMNSQQQLEQCKPIADTMKSGKLVKNTFVSNKIQYVGNRTFGKYFYELLRRYSSNSVIYVKKILESHVYLLNSLQILNTNNLLHLDIKENNVMYDKVNDIFIMIDFGFCIQSKTIELPNYMQATQPFGKVADSYPPWCIEIHLLSYIARYIRNPRTETYKIDDSLFQQKITSTEEMKRRSTLFIKKNFIFKTEFFSNNEIQQFETAIHKWIDGFKGKTWKDVWTLLVSSHKSWDNYGLAVMYLFEFYDSNVSIEPEKTTTSTSKITTKYVDILKKIILAFPEKRSKPEETSQEIKTIFRLVDKKTIQDMTKMTKTTKTTQNPNLKKIKEQKDRRTLNELEEDERLRKQ